MSVDQNQNLSQRVLSLEQTFLRHAVWLVPLLTVVILFLLRYLWPWILMDSAAKGDTSVSFLQGIAVLTMVAFYPFVWWMGLSGHKPDASRFSRVPWALLTSLVLFLLAEIVVRQARIQNMIWSAVRVRAGDNFFVRELSLLRLDVAALEGIQPRTHGLVICGSSQVLHAIDTADLEKELEYTAPVYRRAMAGFFPLEMCTAIDFLRVLGPQTYCFLLSGFDVGVRASLFADAMRPMMTRHGFRNLRNVLPWTIKWTEWRSLMDLQLASALELWRIRDYVRRIAWSFSESWPSAPDDSQQALLQQQEQAITRLGEERTFLETSFLALNVLFQQLIEEGNRVVVFENRINPAKNTEELFVLNAHARNFFKKWEENPRFAFIPVEEQTFQISDDEWLDYTHFNTNARERYTRYVASYFRQKMWDEMQGSE